MGLGAGGSAARGSEVVPARKSAHRVATRCSEGRMIRLETLIELNFSIRAFRAFFLLKLNKQFPVEQFEATVSQSTVPSPPLTDTFMGNAINGARYWAWHPGPTRPRSATRTRGPPQLKRIHTNKHVCVHICVYIYIYIYI